MTTPQYLDNIARRFALGNATEHSFRGDLQQLIESLVPDIRATNEPKRQSCGAPDYILTRKEIPIGHVEAKDIGDRDLDGQKRTGNKEQFDRYKAALPNLIFTDYLDFRLYRDGQFVTSIAIGEVTEKGIRPLPDNFAQFENLVKDFCTYVGQTIKSPKKLAEMMAGKARLLSDVIEKALLSDEDNKEDSTLKAQLQAFQQILIHDITPKSFADVYAQTIAYGMFAARLHDPTLPTFSRQEAAELIPKSNPFLRKLFGYIAGPDIDDRIRWIVDSLVEIFLACNVEEILRNYGKATKMEDPIIHFYETFLSEYDPKLRKARGVWYTPAPVVSFIVRAVDEVLKTEFGLPSGLADTSKVKMNVKVPTSDGRTKSGYKDHEVETHRVQILDPATGTGTFLAEVVKHIHKRFEGQQGIWSNYVETHLLPRLNGFELLMASYAMAHLQLDLLLTETGFRPTKTQRLRVFLTNSLEESHPDTGTLFANWLSDEANEANKVKRDTPVMCVIGNPPYAISSSNKGKWIQGLIADYKKDLNEKKINLDDDYIKFIRYGQHFIDKNGSGILAYISNNSFIDGITHRQMRKHLLESFDKIYILDLHGNANKKEVCPDGSPDQNVFDIMQGVSINIFVKTGLKKKSELGEVFHFGLQGKREFKYDCLSNNSIQELNWVKLRISFPNLFFVPMNFDKINIYEKGFKIDELMNGVSGIETKRDHFAIDFEKLKLQQRINDFVTSDYTPKERKDKFDLRDNEWIVEDAVKELRKTTNWKNSFFACLTRPFDIRWIIYNGTILSRDRGNIMAGMNKGNYGIVLGRQSKEDFATLITNCVCTHKIVTVYDRSFIFPLYLYPDAQTTDLFSQPTRQPNLNMDIVQQIAKGLGLAFTPEREGGSEVCFANQHEGMQDAYKQSFAPIDVLDYIYAVLHSPSYRERYKEFLKIDFPRVPYPTDAEKFWQLVRLGGELRQLHLLESPKVEQYLTQYPVDGDNRVTKPRFEPMPDLTNLQDLSNLTPVTGRVYINDTQYFANVPQSAWEFYIGGYQPAQKWLKDRKERVLGFEEILHYQKIIVALVETERVMGEIDALSLPI
ncbi:MAG: DNA methyltransferase [Saprospiraceae bacterium]|nr:DNA methyltransferase [Saprospiraceae bacterium]